MMTRFLSSSDSTASLTMSIPKKRTENREESDANSKTER